MALEIANWPPATGPAGLRPSLLHTFIIRPTPLRFHGLQPLSWTLYRLDAKCIVTRFLIQPNTWLASPYPEARAYLSPVSGGVKP
jgi:hypothetical protein